MEKYSFESKKQIIQEYLYGSRQLYSIFGILKICSDRLDYDIGGILYTKN
jgi:hypothetical protein